MPSYYTALFWPPGGHDERAWGKRGTRGAIKTPPEGYCLPQQSAGHYTITCTYKYFNIQLHDNTITYICKKFNIQLLIYKYFNIQLLDNTITYKYKYVNLQLLIYTNM